LPPGDPLRAEQRRGDRPPPRARGAHPGRELVLLPAAQARRAQRRRARARGDLLLRRPARPRRRARLRLPPHLRHRGPADRHRRGGPHRRRRPHPARLPRPVDGRAGLRPVLPQRHGRSGRGPHLAHDRRPRPRVGPGHLGVPGARPPPAADPTRRAPRGLTMSQTTVRLTVGQALVRFLSVQYSERDGVERRLFAGMLGIFGHGNVAGVGQALLENAVDPAPEEEALPFYQARNEQNMVDAAVVYARPANRLQTFACAASIGPGSTNMLTGAALATIDRIPVLLLPADLFATRAPDPVLQQLENEQALDASVNDAFRPVSRFFDRIHRPEQLPASLLAAMRVLTDPAETGAVTLCLPQDVQAEAHDWPVELFRHRVWHVPRQVPEPGALERAARSE